MIGILSAGIAPGLALLSFFYLKDRLDSEPLPVVLKTFIIGGLLVLPIMFIQYIFIIEGVGQHPFIRTFILSALFEEFFKWFVFLFVVYKHTAFDSHYDGIVYGVSISLGFATLENIFYLFAHGIEFAFGRAIFPVTSHALFGVILGYYMGKAKFYKLNARLLLSVALIVPTILHGLYDFVLATVTTNWIYIIVPFMIFMWLLALRKVKAANRHSQESVKITNING